MGLQQGWRILTLSLLAVLGWHLECCPEAQYQGWRLERQSGTQCFTLPSIRCQGTRASSTKRRQRSRRVSGCLGYDGRGANRGYGHTSAGPDQLHSQDRGQGAKLGGSKSEVEAMWGKYFEDLKNAYVRELSRYQKAMSKIEQDLATATTTRDEARRALQQFDFRTLGEEDSQATEALATEWHALTAGWQREQEATSDQAVLQRSRQLHLPSQSGSSMGQAPMMGALNGAMMTPDVAARLLLATLAGQPLTGGPAPGFSPCPSFYHSCRWQSYRTDRQARRDSEQACRSRTGSCSTLCRVSLHQTWGSTQSLYNEATTTSSTTTSQGSGYTPGAHASSHDPCGQAQCQKGGHAALWQAERWQYDAIQSLSREARGARTPGAKRCGGGYDHGGRHGRRAAAYSSCPFFGWPRLTLKAAAADFRVFHAPLPEGSCLEMHCLVQAPDSKPEGGCCMRYYEIGQLSQLESEVTLYRASCLTVQFWISQLIHPASQSDCPRDYLGFWIVLCGHFRQSSSREPLLP